MSNGTESHTGTIIPPSNALTDIYGYVVAIRAYSPDRSPALAVQLLVPTATQAEQLQWFSSYDVKDNRELVWVSTLRDAMVHSLPVKLTYDGLRQIKVVEVRSPTYHALGKQTEYSGIVKGISIYEVGLWKENIDTPDTANIYLAVPKDLMAILVLQAADKDIKLAQLEILREAYQNQSKVTITCVKMPVMGDSAKTMEVITGIQVGAKPLSAAPQKTGKGKSISKYP